jgi:hypothetical protein
MWQERIRIGEQPDDSDEEWETETLYWCRACKSKEWGVPVAKALSRIKCGRADLQRVLARTREFKEAKKMPPKEFLVAGTTKKQKRVLLRMEIMDVFRPAAILLKQQQMDQRVIWCDEHRELCYRLKELTDIDEIEKCLREIDNVKLKFRENDQPPGYADVAKSKEALFRFQMAADYSDCWAQICDSAGKLLGGFSACYVCGADETAKECNTLMLSKEWLHKHVDPLAAKQKWKCRICGAKSRRSWA